MDHIRNKPGENVTDPTTSAANIFVTSSASIPTSTKKVSPFYASSAYSSSSSISSFSSSCSSFSEMRSKFKTYGEDYHNVTPSYLIEGSKKKEETGTEEKKSEDINMKGYKALNDYQDKGTQFQQEGERQKKAEHKEKSPWCRIIWDKLMKKEKESKKEEQKIKSCNLIKPLLNVTSPIGGQATCNRDLVEDGYKVFQVVWRCTICTFLNHSLLPSCEKCGMIRVPGTSEWIRKGIKSDECSSMP